MAEQPRAPLPIAGARQTWRTVRDSSRGHRRALLLGVLIGILGAAAGLVAPAVIGRLVDGVQDGTATAGTVAWALVIMAMAALAGAIGSALTVVLISRSYQAVLADLRERLVGTAMNLPQGVVERAGTGDLIARSSDDVAMVGDAAPRLVPAFTTVVFTIVVTFAGMTALDPWFALTLALLIPVYLLTVRWYLATAPEVYRAERAAMSGRAQELSESQRGHRTVVGLDLTEQRHGRVIGASWQVVEFSLRARTVQNMFFGRLNLAEFLGTAAILLLGFWLIQNGNSTVGAATTAVLLFLRLYGPIKQLLLVLDVLQSVLASLTRIVGIVAGGGPGNTATGGGNAVRLSGVRFGYDPDRPVLVDLDLDLEAGSRVAVVGSSGAGKTTLASVLAGIHAPQSGTVDCPPRTAVITQEVHTFAGTLRDNLTLAAPGADDLAVRAALRDCGAAEFVDLLPDGLDTMLGAGAQELTAAQAQQVALARLILADPDLAILDEATAEAGSAHADVLDRAADAALRGRTGLVIAHRLGQAATCDRVVVMDRGRIVEIGSHDELVAAGGVYARLWTAWEAGQPVLSSSSRRK